MGNAVERDERATVGEAAPPGWGVDQPGYSPSKFYTGSSDGHGKQGSVRFNCPPALLAEVQHLVQSGIIPAYRTTNDFFRDAMFHRLNVVASLRKLDKLSRTMHAHIALAERERQVGEIETLDSLIETTCRLVETAMGRQDDVLIAEIETTAWAEAQNIREPYRTRLLRRLQEMGLEIRQDERDDEHTTDFE